MIRTFYHYSISPNLTLDNIELSHDSTLKPGGIWLSYDYNNYGWADWCLVENFMPEKLAYRYQVDVNMESVLNISSQKTLLEFCEKYRNESNLYTLDYMNWRRVVADYKGIAFIPYCRYWTYDTEIYRSDLVWYSAVDCESACIWDKSVVEYFCNPELTGIRGKEGRVMKRRTK